MSRWLVTFLGLLGVGYLFFYWYDSGSNHTIDLVICIEATLVSVGVIAHIVADRRLSYWTPTAIGLVAYAMATGALFAWFGYRYWHGEIEPGTSQAWLDIVRDSAAVGVPIFGLAILVHHVRKRRGAPTVEPITALESELTTYEINTPTYRGPNRRTGLRDRRSTAEIYSRDRGDY